MFCKHCEDETPIAVGRDGIDRCCRCKKEFDSEHLSRIRADEAYMETKDQKPNMCETKYDLYPKRS